MHHRDTLLVVHVRVCSASLSCCVSRVCGGCGCVVHDSPSEGDIGEGVPGHGQELQDAEEDGQAGVVPLKVKQPSHTHVFSLSTHKVTNHTQ